MTTLRILPLCLLLVVTACQSARQDDAPAPTEPQGEAAQADGAQQADAQDAQADAAAVDPQGQLAADVRTQDLRGQLQAFLLQQHLANARMYLDRLDLDAAAREADAALQLEPESLAAKQIRAEIGGLRGETIGTGQTVVDEMNARFALQVQQLKAEVQDALAKARMMVARNDYQGAITELEIANTTVRYAPAINWDGLDVEAKTMLEKVRDTRLSAERSADDAARRRATEALQAEEAERVERQSAAVNNMIERAIDSFQRAEYEDAENYARQALLKDPRNQEAKEIKDAAFRAGRTQVRDDYVVRKNEQFRRWKEALREMQIPWTGVITLPNPERWNELSELRSTRRGLDVSQKIDESERALREELATKLVTVPIIEGEESLTVVIDRLRLSSGLPLVVDPAAEAAVEGAVFDLSFQNSLTAEQALNLITKMAGENVTWTVRHEAVLVTTKQKARNQPIIYNHDVQDLVFGLTDFLGPRIDRLRLLNEMQDEDGGGPFGGIGEKPKILEPADLSTLIQENVAVGTWGEEGVSIDAGDTGFILINHTPEVQELVKQFLEDLRRFSSALVTIESKFLNVSSNWIQEIGVDFRGLDSVDVSDVTNGLEDQASQGLDNGGTGTAGNNASGRPSAGIFYDDGGDGDFRATTQNFFGTALGNSLSTVGGMTFQLAFLNDLNLSAILRAVEKSSNIELINDQVVSVHNTQRAFVQVVNQRAYIQDFDVEVAQFQAVADPQVNVLHEGVVLDVRPTIQHNRRYLNLEIQPTVAKVIALRNFSSTLGGNTSPIQFQLPEIEVQSVFTTAVIPDGGSIMLGGLSKIRNIERRAEVPWLAKIPLVGFFFKEEGYNDENKSLMILIRARITDVRDELKKIETR